MSGQASGTRPVQLALAGTERICDWCPKPIPPGARSDAECCGVVCRKRRNRFTIATRAGHARRPPVAVEPAGVPSADGTPDAGRMRFAYADPPYPGKAGYYVEGEEVDHRDLVELLVAGYPDGWALSTSAAALRDVLPLCPPGVRTCVWRRRVRYARSRRALSAWEPLLVVGGRQLATDAAQTLVDDLATDDILLDDVLDYRGRYGSFPRALIGMKPPEFAVWMFGQLGARGGDDLVDLYPGSGAIARAWAIYTSLDTVAPRDASRRSPSPSTRDASRSAGAQASLASISPPPL